MTRKILQINVTSNVGSTGKIAEDIGHRIIQNGWQSWIAYSRGSKRSESNLIKIGNEWDVRLHGLQTRLFDRHGLASNRATIKLIETIIDIEPDIIHLHNIHGYFINYPILFTFLKEYKRPIVWTLHDCWPWTGHCAYYEFSKCTKWQFEGCHNCQESKSYPTTIWRDRSYQNFIDKKNSFLGISNITLIPVSNWLKKEISKSFLKDYPLITIHNGINTKLFHSIPKLGQTTDKKYILGVANIWERRKGLNEFFKLRKILPNNFTIILVGLSEKQISHLPDGIIGIQKTQNQEQLVSLYNKADIFVNPTLEDNFPTTNLEALACGTPIITYETGGSPEAVDEFSGIIVKKGDVEGLANAILNIIAATGRFTAEDCRQRVLKYFNKDIQFNKYIELYESLLSH